MKNLFYYLTVLFLLLTTTTYGQYADYTVTRSITRTKLEYIQANLGQPLFLGEKINSDPTFSCQSREGLFGLKLWYDRKGRTTQENWHYEIKVSIAIQNGYDADLIPQFERITEIKTLRVDEIRAENLQTYIHHHLFEKDLDGNPLDIHTHRSAVIYIHSITKSANAPDDIYLDMEYYRDGKDELAMDYNLKFGGSAMNSNQNEQLQLFWDYLPGAEEYDLEWVFIDSKSNLAINNSNVTPQQAFDYQEPTRITTSDQHFVLEMNYPKGKVYFRVRGVGHYENYPDQPRYASWQYGQENPVIYEIIENYEKDKIWQSVTTYAEEGKYKKVVSYLDGSMRSRQVVTHLNTDNLALVAETKYDYEGRGVVQILPVPLAAEPNERVASLHYREKLNQFTAGDQKSVYDNEQTSLARLSTSSGVGKYYSPSNDLETIHRDYLPNADGYAFTQVVYDNEGRVKSQGGVGELFQYDTPGEDRRSTEYFYANTNETELRRMFGRNVGKASHYRKQAVRDANGQVSVSYMDQAGNVIATALAGESPEMLLALDKDTDEQLNTINVSLNDNNRIDLENHTSTSTNEILNVTPSTLYTIEYGMKGTKASFEDWCKTCKYELNVYIYTPSEERIGLVENQEIGGLECPTIGDFKFEEKVLFKEIGVYTLVKELKIKEKSVAEIRTQIEDSERFKIESEQILTTYLSQIDYTNCEICVGDNCVEGVTDIAAWATQMQQLRCENITTQINYEEEQGKYPIGTHPERCHLDDCTNNFESNRYTQIIAADASTWTEAVTKGYARPININLTGVPAAIANHVYDPYFITIPAYGVGRVNEMVTLLSNVASDIQGNPLNAWQAAEKLANEQAPILNQSADKLRWQFFYGFYIQAKNTLHNRILAEKGCNYLPKDQDPIVINPVLPITPQEQDTFFDDNFPPLNCEQQVAAWMEQIKSLCYTLTEAQEISIIENLEAYCAITNDGGNAYGFLYYEECDDPIGRTAATTSKMNSIIEQNLKTDKQTQELITAIQKDKQKLQTKIQIGGDSQDRILSKGAVEIPTALDNCLCQAYIASETQMVGPNGEIITVHQPPGNFVGTCKELEGYTELMQCVQGEILKDYDWVNGGPLRDARWSDFTTCGWNGCQPEEPKEQPACICELTQQYNGMVPFVEARACLRENRDYFIETFGEDGEITSYTKNCAKINVLVEINGESYVDMAALEQCLNTSFGCTTTTTGNLCDLGYAGTVAEIKAILGYTQRPNDTDQSDNAKMARCIWNFDDAQIITLETLEQCAGVVLDCPQGTGCNTSGNEYLDNIKTILTNASCQATFEQIIVENPCKSYITHERTSQKEYPVLKYPEYNYPSVTGAPGLNTNASDKYQQFGQGDFTLEAYVTLNGIAAHNYNIMYATTPQGEHPDYYYKGFFWNVDRDTRQVNFWFPGGRAYTGQALPMQECIHVAVVRQNGFIQIYFNGQPQSMYMDYFALQEANDWAIDFSTTKTRRIHIASHSFFGTTNHAGGYFPGIIREVRMWNEAKIPTTFTSPDELVINNPTAEPNLLGYWKVNEGQGNRIIDYSANPNDAFFTYNISSDSRLPVWEQPTTCVITGAFTQTIRVCAEYDQTVLNTIFPTMPSLDDLVQKCKDELEVIARIEAQDSITRLLDKYQEKLLQEYYAKCFAQPFTEDLKYEYAPSEYHYTLYYYDQAGSLVQTVPPKGVQLLTVAEAQAGNVNPNHRMRTRYRYNSLGQPRWQDTPDGGTSTFVYDDLGQLRLSQNAEQALHGQYSYTKFDNESRTIEVGQLETTESLTQLKTAMNDLQTGVSFPALGYEKTEITRTFYDYAIENDLGIEQTYLRGRITMALIQEDGKTIGARSLYSYNIHGKVHQLWQQLPELEETKTLTYDYDLVSGNVNEVNYQKGKEDEFSHRYYYDADNRITSVETSHDGYIWDEDAFYQYYAHSPLARTEIGEYKVQAMDYAYTLQGWIKGVNQFEESPTTTEKYKYVSQKTASYALHYYTGEYQSIEGHSWTANTNYDLFNGNITAMSTDLSQLGNLIRAYRHDQLGRLREVNNTDGTLSYHETFTYDANGNILTNTLHNRAGQQIDNAIYNYIDDTNKNLLEYISDPQHGEHHAGFDLMNQEEENFDYNAIGGLTKDEAMGVTKIEWTAYNKRKKIIKEDETIISYRYDVMNNRIYKKVEKINGEIEITHYLRDSEGNIIATYKDQSTEEFTIYGTGHVGTYTAKTEKGKQTLGSKKYEFNNHLGNVLSVYTDNKYGTNANSDIKADNYNAFVVSQKDYLSFGAITEGRNFKSEEYLYTFNGKELDKDTGWQNYGFRDYNPVYKRFDMVDPLAKSYPWYTPYQFAGNMPIRAIDLDGLEPVVSNEGFLVGYTVQPGQGPTQIAADLNNPETQAAYGYTIPNNQQINWETMVDHPNNKKKYFNNVETAPFKNRKDQPGYKYLNMNPGDYIDVTFIYNSQQQQSQSGTEVKEGAPLKYGKMDASNMGLGTGGLLVGLIDDGAGMAAHTGEVFVRAGGQRAGNLLLKGALTTKIYTGTLGTVFGVYNAYGITDSYEKGQINSFQFGIEHGSNTFATLGGVYGAGWGFGWELGRVTSQSEYSVSVKQEFQTHMFNNYKGIAKKLGFTPERSRGSYCTYCTEERKQYLNQLEAQERFQKFVEMLQEAQDDNGIKD